MPSSADDLEAVEAPTPTISFTDAKRLDEWKAETEFKKTNAKIKDCSIIKKRNNQYVWILATCCTRIPEFRLSFITSVCVKRVRKRQLGFFFVAVLSVSFLVLSSVVVFWGNGELSRSEERKKVEGPPS